MSAALVPPFVVAALLLCVAGGLKLRSPEAAAAALHALALPGGVWAIRALAAAELALGGLCAVHPTGVSAAVLAGAYGAFSAVAALLVRKRAACGCFGEGELPATMSHSAAGAALGAVAAATALAGPRGFGWILGRPATTATVLVLGIAGALYATVIVYTELPAAWAAWSGE